MNRTHRTYRIYKIYKSYKSHFQEEKKMESRAKLFGHAVHPILVVFPLGLFATAVIFDAIGWATGNGRLMEASFRIIAAGIIGGMIAALFGLIFRRSLGTQGPRGSEYGTAWATSESYSCLGRAG